MHWEEQSKLYLIDLQQRMRFGASEIVSKEFDLSMLNALEVAKRRKILATIAEWEKQTGLRVRFEGVIGKSAL